MTNRTIAATTRPTTSPPPMTSGIAEAMDDEKSTATPSTGVVVNAAMRRVLGLGATAVWVGVEHDRGDRGAAVLGHETHARREVEQRRAGLELVGLAWRCVAGAASISACFSRMVAQPASMSA